MNQPPVSTDPNSSPAIGVPGANPLAQKDERWQIRVRGLNKTFGPQHVLRGVDLDIERGRTNTNKMVNGMLHAADVRNVIINYDEPVA